MPAFARIEKSARPRVPRSMDQGAVDEQRDVEVTILLRENPSGPMLEEVIAQQASQPLSQRRYYTREQYAQLHGSCAEDRRAVRKFAREHNLEVVDQSIGARTMRIRGKAADINAAFGVELHDYVVNERGKLIRYHAHTQDITIEQDFFHDASGQQRVQGIFGLDSRPIARPRFQRFDAHPRLAPSLTPMQVANAYDYPKIDGKGVCIGIIELGGTISDADITAYFKAMGLPKPIVKHVSVDGAKDKPDPNGADVEVALDVEIVGAMAPGCTIVIYDAPNSERGFIDALAAASNDKVNKPVAVSISWGAAEKHWSRFGMRGMDVAAMAGASMGVTFTAAAGDNGASDGLNDGLDHCDHPSSAPHIVAVGGTTLHLKSDDTIASERVWGGAKDRGATGGGVSDHFDTPDYQSNNGIHPVSKNPDKRKGRGDPDVGGVANPATGYRVLSNGKWMTIGGTSAGAPQWAALFALGAKQQGHGYGYVHPLLYAVPDASFHDITAGNNGDGHDNGYKAKKGYDLCTGRGTPVGTKLIAELATAVPTPAVDTKSRPARRIAPASKDSITIINQGGTVNIRNRVDVDREVA